MEHCLHQTGESNLLFTKFKEICCNCGEEFDRSAEFNYDTKSPISHGSFLPNRSRMMAVSAIIDRSSDSECLGTKDQLTDIVNGTEHIRMAYPGLGKKIKSYRNSKGFSQYKLAEILDVSWMTIHRWEKDLRGIKLPMLEKVSKALKVDLKDLMTYTEGKV